MLLFCQSPIERQVVEIAFSRGLMLLNMPSLGI